jgi:hypothetical protein
MGRYHLHRTSILKVTFNSSSYLASYKVTTVLQETLINCYTILLHRTIAPGLIEQREAYLWHAKVRWDPETSKRWAGTHGLVANRQAITSVPLLGLLTFLSVFARSCRKDSTGE